jgi:hypothetical protein
LSLSFGLQCKFDQARYNKLPEPQAGRLLGDLFCRKTGFLVAA